MQLEYIMRMFNPTV